MLPWSDLHVRLGTATLRARSPRQGHLYWWRLGQPADGLAVTDGRGTPVPASGVDWAGFPATPPPGYATRPSPPAASGRLKKLVPINLTSAQLAMLDRQARAVGMARNEYIVALLQVHEP